MCSMRMFGACINKELFDHSSTQLVFGQHAFDAIFNNGFRFSLLQFGSSFAALASWVTGEADILLLLQLAAGEAHLVCIDDNYVISGIHVRCERRLVFAAEHMCNARKQTASRLSFSIYQIPLAGYCFLLCGFCFKTQCIHGSQLYSMMKFRLIRPFAKAAQSYCHLPEKQLVQAKNKGVIFVTS